MPPLTDTTKPQLASGCRRLRSEDEDLVLFPEGAIRLEGPGRQILDCCDGQRSLQQIVETLQSLYREHDPGEIREDVAEFLGKLFQQRIVDYQ